MKSARKPRPSGSYTSISAERARSVLEYSEETGVFRWRDNAKNRCAGLVAGAIDAYGYVQIGLDGYNCKGHRLAWLYVTGNWPAQEIDHRNRDKADNRFCNLREATRSENSQNHSPVRGNRTGFLGVRLTRSGKLQAVIRVGGKTTCLGSYSTPQEASAAYLAAKRALHSGFSE